MKRLYYLGIIVGLISISELFFKHWSFAGIIPSQSIKLDAIETNEHYIDKVTKEAKEVDLNNVLSVFKYVFTRLPEQVRVYPSENYYYFKFHINSHEIWGNFLLDVEQRNHGKLSFGYFEHTGKPIDLKTTLVKGEILGTNDGVEVAKITSWVYLVRYEGKTVQFELMPMEQIPTVKIDAPSEQFVGRTLDESGFRFNLVFRRNPAGFMFILDESHLLPDSLITLSDKVFIGNRTDFVFFNDQQNSRKILIGVKMANILQNNYYDGPADQLHDNYIKGESFREMIEAAYSNTKGKINYRGYFYDLYLGYTSRVLIAPYQKFLRRTEMLNMVDSCLKLEDDKKLTCLTSPKDNI